MPRWIWGAAAVAILVSTAAGIAMYARPSLHAARWVCLDGKDIKPDDRAAIVSAANDALTTFKRGDADSLIRNAHPMFGTVENRDSLIKPMRTLAEELAKVESPLTPSDIKLVAGDLARGTQVYCYLHEPDGLLYTATAPGTEPRALVTFRIEGHPLTVWLHVELWQHDGRWLLTSFRNNPASYNGHDSAYYVQAGDDALAKQDRFSAAILYSVANDLATISSTILTHQQSTIEPKQGPLLGDSELTKAIHNWTVEGQTYRVAAIAAHPNDTDGMMYALLVAYESKRPGDAKSLFDWLKATHPILSHHFDAVIFVAKNGVVSALRF